MHVRLQTWAPFTCQIYVNGHDYVMQKLTQAGIRFEKIDNAFVQLDDPKQAQRIANRFAKLPWPKILEKYARLVNPLLSKELKQMSHYWVIDQAEFSTDLLFTSKHALGGLFARLLEFALLTLQSEEDLSSTNGPQVATNASMGKCKRGTKPSVSRALASSTT